MSSHDFVPAWSRRAIWYQIFPERFANGDLSNDPTLASQRNSWPHDLSTPWQVHPWTADWYAQQPYEQAHSKPIWHHLQRRRYGGDLQGILDRLDYLQDLGVNALYLNPVFEAPSLHKYDGATYHHIDPHFGPDPEGDKRLMQQETPRDPATWVWTAADRLMLHLIAEVHRRGMRLIFDGVFNHMGLNSWAFQDVVRHGRRSEMRDWFKIRNWRRGSRFAPFTYEGWFAVDELPELNQDDNGITAGPKGYIFDITRRWMDPDGDGNPADGVDGWRLDVAFCVRHGFWRDWRSHVKAINPDAYLTAEIVTEDSNEPYLRGDEFDAVMNYLWAFASMEYFVERPSLGAAEFDQRLRALREAYPACVAYAMQNLLDSHDTARIASHIVNRDQVTCHDWATYGRLSRPEQNPAYDTRGPNAEERDLQRLLALFQMTYVGAPMIYYGDEAGMWGANDPCCRKPMVWPELSYAAEATLADGSPRPDPQPVAFDHTMHTCYRQLIHLRRGLDALQVGDFQTLLAGEGAPVYAFLRGTEAQQVAVALNNSAEPQPVVLPLAGSWRDHLAGGAAHQAASGGLALTLPPRWGVVLERIAEPQS